MNLLKKANTYRVTIEEVNNKDGQEPKTLQFEVQDREDLIGTVEKINQGSGLDEQFSTQVGVAIRLLGPAMMQNRKHPLFADFFPHFKNFMQNLKSTIKNG